MNTEMKKTVVYSTGDKILNIMKEQDMDIPEHGFQQCGDDASWSVYRWFSDCQILG